MITQDNETWDLDQLFHHSPHHLSRLVTSKSKAKLDKFSSGSRLAHGSNQPIQFQTNWAQFLINFELPHFDIELAHFTQIKSTLLILIELTQIQNIIIIKKLQKLNWANEIKKYYFQIYYTKITIILINILPWFKTLQITIQ